MTFEDLYKSLGDDENIAREYAERRHAKVADIADYIAAYLRDGVDVRTTAEWIMTGAEETGRFNGDYINGEVPSTYTKNKNPLPFTI